MENGETQSKVMKRDHSRTEKNKTLYRVREISFPDFLCHTILLKLKVLSFLVKVDSYSVIHHNPTEIKGFLSMFAYKRGRDVC